jgi:periplasmic divalent cation tolerance protein
MDCGDSVKIMVGTTTYPSKEDAVSAIDLLIRNNLAKCAQIVGPIESHYMWKGEKQVEIEWRVTLKYSFANKETLSKELIANHPYDTPQWVEWEAKTGDKYGSWINSESD